MKSGRKGVGCVCANRTAATAIVCMPVLLTVASTVEAQVVDSLDELLHTGRLQAGDGIYVTDAEGRRIKGDVVDLSPISLSITDGRGVWNLADDEIRGIERQDPLENGIWIGTGFAFAGVVGFCRLEIPITHNDACYATLYFTPLAIGLGVFVGAMIDASRHEVLYRQPAAASVRLSPLLSADAVGARLSVGW